MPDPECLNPPLLPIRERDEVAELHDLLVVELVAQPFPQVIVDAVGIPDEHARIQQRGRLALVETIRPLEVQELVVVRLRKTLLSARERPLRPSVVAVDRL